MSLINDALKRATQTPSSPADFSAREPHTPMQPVEYRRGGLPWYFFPTLLLILAGGVWFVVKGLESTRLPAGLTVHAREPQPQTDSSTDVNPETLAAGLMPPSVDTPYVPPAQPPRRNFSLEDTPSTPDTTPTTPATPATPATSETAKPAFKLQSVFYRPSNPSAMVNGKNVSIGSRINGAVVTAITREGVTLESQGETTVLTLE